MKESPKLKITFHNPNTGDGLVKELVKIAAELAKSQVEAKILHSNEAAEHITTK